MLGHVDRPPRDHKQATVLSIPACFYNISSEFLIDSGAERSVIPPNLAPALLIHPCSIVLTGVDGKPIEVYGQITGTISIRLLRQTYRVSFIVANSKPILGADFLTEHGFCLDMKHRLLTDPVTEISAELKVQKCHGIYISEQKGDRVEFIAKFYPDLSSPPDYSQLPHTAVSHEIKTTEGPIFSKPRPLPPGKLEVARKSFDTLMKLNIIRPAKSAWASPLHLVRKKDGTFRPCGDYRRVNAITVPDRYPIPNLQNFHHRLADAIIFSKVDLIKAYHFIPMNPADIEKTAITTPFGSFEYLRMPFGLKNSTSTFQRYIDSQLEGLDFALAYIDDILIFSKSNKEHAEHLHAVFQRLQKAGLKVNEEKCEIGKSTIEFLGYQIDRNGISPPQSRIEPLMKLQRPDNIKELQRYLGMFSFYQRCIPHFAHTCLPLRQLVTAKKYEWTTEHNVAFCQLKNALATAVKLSFPKADCPISITADASNTAIGGCLNQTIDGENRPLSFYSRKLSDTESRYSTFDRELLAVFAAVKKWKHLIDGSAVTVFTDHKPLVGAFHNTKERLSDRQQRHLSFISEHVCDIIHIAGRDNIVADTLSRCVATVDAEPCDLLAIAKEQMSDVQSYQQYKSFEVGAGKQLFCETSQTNPRPVVPVKFRYQIYQLFHNLSHPGIKATIRLIVHRYYWSTLKQDVKKWCSECLQCQSAKIGRHTQKPIRSLPCPTKRFSDVHIDIVGPLETPADTSDARYLLTMIDAHTRWIEAAPLANISAESVAQNFFLYWISRFGPPLTLCTDRGTQFTSEIMKRLNDLLGIHHIRTTAYNPRANGLIERVHRSLKVSLKARGGNWLKQLPLVLLGLRIQPCDDGSSAFSRVTGEQPLVPSILPNNMDLTELAVKLHRLPFDYRPTREKFHSVYEPKQLEKATHVWLRLDRVRKALEAPYQGPFKVLSRTADTITIEIRGKPEVVTIDRVKPAKLPKSFPQIKNKSKTNEEEGITKTIEQKKITENKKTIHDYRTRSGRKVKFKFPVESIS